MQLKTTFIGTGTLAIAAASLTLARAAAAAIPATGPEKRQGYPSVSLHLNLLFPKDRLPDALQPGDICTVVGYVGKSKGRK